jgi:membrane protein DedA with SNARE-associated domain
VPAGVARMNFWRFTMLSFAGSFPWSFGLAWGGYELGSHWERIGDWFRPVVWPIVIICLLAIAYYVFRRIREIRHEARGPVPGED